MSNIVHIPKGHEVVKRYWFTEDRNDRSYSFYEDPSGQLVHIEDVKKHLVEWLESELAKSGPAVGEFGYKHGYELALKRVLHHIKVIL